MTASTPEEERAVLAAAAARIDADLREAFEDVADRVRAGASPREAVADAMGDVQADLASAIALGLSAVSGEEVTASDVLRMHVGPLQLSARLWQEAAQTSDVVAGIVERHLQGYVDARRLAMDLFEGYGFRAPEAEPLKLAASNPRLPRYLREVLLTEPGVERALAVNFARMQARSLSTDALRAAYSEALDAISEAEKGVGAAGLKKRLEVAFFERLRYFAQRIAQTEIHRAYARREAQALMQDADVKFVQVRRAPGGKGAPCICVLYTGRDLYGLGPGVYPKARAPLPAFHPYCRCIVVPRLDLDAAQARPEDDEADVYFLRRLQPSVAARVMGSRAKLERVLGGQEADAVFNAALLPAYRVRTLAEAAP